MIVVVDSTDRERISVTKEELYKMLAHEVSKRYGFSGSIFIVGKIWMVRVKGSRFTRCVWKLHSRLGTGAGPGWIEAPGKHLQSHSPVWHQSRPVLLEALSFLKPLIKL